MAAKFTKVSKVVLCLLVLVPFFSYALEFTLPKDVTEEELANASDEEAQYGSSSDEAEATESENNDDEDESLDTDESDDVEEFAEVDDEDDDEPDEIEDTETAEIDDDDPGFMEFPLEEPETETAEVAETETQEVSTEGQGQITGQVFDKETGAPIRGVAIAVEGTDMGTITDEAGNFKLSAVPEGNYTLAYFKTGYLAANVTDVAVVPGKVKTLDFALPPRPAELSDDVYDLGTITVTAEQANQQMMKLELRMESDTILDVFSSEDFSKFAASDVGEAIKRVSGVTVQGGQFAVIRGLEERYSSTTLNGVPVPSPDPDKQSVPLDLFSSEIVSNLTITKTFEPSLPGNSAGGSIGIWTNVYPEELTINFSYKTGFNENAQDNFLSMERSKSNIDFENIDNSSNLPSPDISNDDIAPTQSGADLDQSIGIEIGGRHEIFGSEFRGLVTFSAKEKFRSIEGTRENRRALPAAVTFPNGRVVNASINSFTGNLNTPQFLNIPGDVAAKQLSFTNGVYDQQISTEEDQLNALASFEYDLDSDGRHTVGGTYFFTEKDEKFANLLNNGQYRELSEFPSDDFASVRDFANRYTNLGNVFFGDLLDEFEQNEDENLTVSEIVKDGRFITTTIAKIERSLEVFQLNGKNKVLESDSFGSLELSWNLSHSKAEQTESDVITLSGILLPDGTYFSNSFTDSGEQFEPRVSWLYIDEEQDFARVDLNHSIEINENLQFITSAGGSFERAVRNSVLISYDLQLSQSERLTDFAESVEGALTGFLAGNSEPLGAAVSSRDIDGVYFSNKITLWEKFDLIGGLRMEKLLMTTAPSLDPESFFYNADVLVNIRGEGQTTFTPFNAQFLGVNGGQGLPVDFEGRIDETNYLPAASFTYRPGENIRATLAYSETNVRPSFKDFTYVTSRDPVTLDYFIGNPLLETSDVQSLDFRFEYAWGSGDLFSIGVFYKEVDDAIEVTSVRGTNGITNIPYNNPSTAEIKGVEFEIRKNLGFVEKSILQYFDVGGNITLIDATIGVLPALEDILTTGFQYINSDGDLANIDPIYNIQSAADSPTGEPAFLDAPYTERELFQQPEWIVNADISFEHPEWRTRATLSYFAQSDVLETAEGFEFIGGNRITPSVFLRSFHEVNFTFSQDLFFLSLKGSTFIFQVKNLTDSERATVYGDDFGGQPESEFKLGRTYSFGLNLVF